MTTLNEAWGTVTSPVASIDGTYTWTLTASGASGRPLSVRTAGQATAGGDGAITLVAHARCEQPLDTVDMAVTVTINPLAEVDGQVRLGPCARNAVSEATFYAWTADWNATQFFMFKVVTGTINFIGSTPTFAASVTPVQGDTLTLEATGTSTVHLVGKVNGSEIFSMDDSSSPLSSGVRGGIYVFVNLFNENPNGVTAWTATDISAPPSTTRRHATLLGVG